MSDVLSAEDVGRMRARASVSEYVSVTDLHKYVAALARSHEALRSERDEWLEERLDAISQWEKADAHARSLNEREEALREALQFYANLDLDEVPYRWTLNDDPDIGHVARFALAVLGHASPAAADEERAARPRADLWMTRKLDREAGE